jgi:hypothetical protein
MTFSLQISMVYLYIYYHVVVIPSTKKLFMQYIDTPFIITNIVRCAKIYLFETILINNI